MEPDVIHRQLAATLPAGSVIGRDDERFDDARRIWNGLADRRPAAVVRATETDHVATTVRFAAEHGILLAVRGGGHSLPGLSTCDDGIVLDLGGLADVAIDPAARTAVVGGGATLGDLDRATVPFGLVTPAGVISHTGVAGLTLGGGMGWLSRRLGLTIDSLLGVELVLADGRIIEVDADHEPDLFWGVRGGGGNFGVVTRFRFRLHDLGDVVIGAWDYPVAEAGAILPRYQELAAAAPRTVTSAINVTAASLSVTALASGASAGAEDVVARYGRIGDPTAGTFGEQTYLELQSRGDDHVPWGRRYYAKGGFVDTMDGEVIGAIAGAIATSPSPDSEVYAIQLGGAIADIDDAATAYQGRAAGHYWIVQPVWDDPADDERCLAWGRDHGRRFTERSMARNYVNEQGDAGAEVAEAAYGATTYRRLGDLKARFDPTNVFRLNQNIRPTLPASASTTDGRA